MRKFNRNSIHTSILYLLTLTSLTHGQTVVPSNDEEGNVVLIWYLGKSGWLAEQKDKEADLAKRYPNFVELVLSDHTVTQGEIDYIATLKNLEYLALGSSSGECVIMDANLAPLSQLQKLKELEIFWPIVDDAAISFIEDIKSLKSILIFNSELCENGQPSRLTDKIGSSLLMCESLTDIYLWFEGDFSDIFIYQICQLSQLEILEISSPKLTDVSLAILAERSQLEVLKISSPNFTDDGIEKLCELKSLKKLSLKDSEKVTHKSLKFIATLPDIRFLDLPYKIMTRADFEIIAGMKHLEYLKVSSAAVSGNDLLPLKNHPALKIAFIQKKKLSSRSLEILDSIENRYNMENQLD